MLKTGKSLYFHSTLQNKKKKKLFTIIFEICYYLSFPADDRRQSVVVLWVNFLSLILDLLLLLVQIGDLQGAEEMDRDREEERYWKTGRERRRGEGQHERERERGEGGGEDHEVRSVTWRGEAKNNSLIIHIQGFEVGDSQLLTGRQRLCSLELIRVRQRGGREAGQWIMWEQQAHPEISSISTRAAGWHREEENNETSHHSSKTGSR